MSSQCGRAKTQGGHSAASVFGMGLIPNQRTEGRRLAWGSGPIAELASSDRGDVSGRKKEHAPLLRLLDAVWPIFRFVSRWYAADATSHPSQPSAVNTSSDSVAHVSQRAPPEGLIRI